ncbi:MAG: AAA family ATPase [bacterium]|nr:AAA family ATPase [bacterium]
MRITNITIPKSQISNGLSEVKMRRLGQVVLIAGKNGSGKTRLLNLISTLIGSKPPKQQVELAKRAKEGALNAIKQNIEIIEKLKIDNRPSSKQLIATREQDNEAYKKTISNYDEILNYSLIETDIPANKYDIVHFVPKEVNIKDYNIFRGNEIIRYANQLDSIIGVDALSNGTFAKIKIIQDRYSNAKDPEITTSMEEREKAIEEYNKLKELIRIFLNTDLKRNIDGPTLFDFPLGQSNLSEGQRVLLQFCLAIHCQQKSLDNLILFLDEPENHLHPSIIIEIIERIKSKTPHGQIWISTHSIPLLSYFDTKSLWFMENGKITSAGSTPETVLKSLLGDDDRISKLQDFTCLPSLFASYNYAFESLFHPPSVNTGPNDPQMLQIRDEIKVHLKNKDKIRILDYGAGKGRLLGNIMENNKEPIDKFISWFDYIAFDKIDSDRYECTSLLKSIYSDCDKRYFNQLHKIFNQYDKNSFDVVVMCNVLHETEPNEWLSLFSQHCEIDSLLNGNGILLIVEDQEIPIGEKAYQKGYIVLDTSEIKELFQIKEVDTDFVSLDARGDGRLKCHRIKKEYFLRITEKSIKDALKLLKKTAIDQIKYIRNLDPSYKNGKRHAFWIQQLANSTLVLKDFE